MSEFYNNDPQFRMQTPNMGNVFFFPRLHATPSPDARGLEPIDDTENQELEFELTTIEHLQMNDELGEISVREAIRDAIERHPSSYKSH